MKQEIGELTPRQRLYIECRKVKITKRGLERWDRKATAQAIRNHPLGKELYPELFEEAK